MEDWLPFEAAEAAVDAADSLLDLPSHELELLHAGAGRNGDLDERYVAVPFGMTLEVAFEAFEAFQHALHVVEALG